MIDNEKRRMEHTSPEIGKVRFTCPHCGAKAAFAPCFLQSYIGSYARNVAEVAVRMGTSGAKHFASGAKAFAAHIAPVVDDVAIFVCRCEEKKRLIWLGNNLVYPIPTNAPQAMVDMPVDVRAIYDEAARVSAASPRAAAALLRLGLESLLKNIWPTPTVKSVLGDKGGDGENLTLGNRVDLLYDARLLSPSVFKMAQAVRLIGNEASHEPGMIQAEEEEELVPLLFQFLNMIVDELITRPQQAEKAEAEAKKRKSDRG